MVRASRISAIPFVNGTAYGLVAEGSARDLKDSRLVPARLSPENSEPAGGLCCYPAGQMLDYEQ